MPKLFVPQVFVAIAISRCARRSRLAMVFNFPILATSAILAIPSPPHPAFFQLLLQTKHLFNSTFGPPLRHAWVALGPPLGHPWVTQSQSQTQSQSAEGRKPKKPRGAKPGSPPSPVLAWRGGTIAAIQTVIVLCRWPKARALSAVEGERRSREPNDLNLASEFQVIR